MQEVKNQLCVFTCSENGGFQCIAIPLAYECNQCTNGFTITLSENVFVNFQTTALAGVFLNIILKATSKQPCYLHQAQ